MIDRLKRTLGWEREDNGKPDPPRGAGLGEKKHDGAHEADRHALITVPPVQAVSAPREGEILPESHTMQAQSETNLTQKTERNDADSKSDLRSKMRGAWAKVRTKDTPTAEPHDTENEDSPEPQKRFSRKGLASSAAKRWSFLWATAAAWLIGFEFLLAAYDRLILALGTSAGSMPRAEYLRNGGDPSEWGLFDGGSAYWMKQTLSTAWEHGQNGRVAIALLIGFAPLIGDAISQLLDRSSKARKWTLVVVYGAPFFWISMTYYFPSFGYKAWWEVQLTALAALSWWGWYMSKGREPGFTTFLMRIPLAALITGALAYSPGAAF